ncbi:DUF952 domain-containing protein [Aureimonas sp. Leaf454]|uniref:DUF952 domain-containing protein n=1 Tax=Aureimonas sp. Leaf454 TaxID=1736381 RepID=UPI0012E37CFC|nr:DUF952 domain-containing protein [Aureimonas sp. Leaf454]
MSSEPIYKIAPRALWEEAESTKRFEGAPIDRADGYIHLSTAAQVRETAAKHFAGATDLVLIGVDPARLGDALKWEPSRGGQLFPHLYGPLALEAVLFAEALPVGPSGFHIFPASIR